MAAERQHLASLRWVLHHLGDDNKMLGCATIARKYNLEDICKQVGSRTIIFTDDISKRAYVNGKNGRVIRVTLVEHRRKGGQTLTYGC